MLDVLVIKPSSLGDIIHAAPAIERLSRSRPDCRVTWVANSQYAEFVRELPGVFVVLPFPRHEIQPHRLHRWLPRAAELWRRLRRGFDVALDLQGLQRSGLLARASGAAERFGPRDARELAWVHYNRRIRVPAGLTHAADRVSFLVHEVSRRSALLAAARPVPRELSCRIPVPPWAREEARRILGPAPGRRLVALCPGTRWESKLLPAPRWADLLRLLKARRPDLLPVFLGAPGEERLAREALALAGPGIEALDLTGRGSLWRTAAILERSLAAVTVDSAPLHLAAAAGAATVAVFGPTDPERVAPRGPRHRVVCRPLECLACYRRRCPLPRRLCLPDLEAPEVLAALEEVLEVAPEESVVPERQAIPAPAGSGLASGGRGGGERR